MSAIIRLVAARETMVCKHGLYERRFLHAPEQCNSCVAAHAMPLLKVLTTLGCTTDVARLLSRAMSTALELSCLPCSITFTATSAPFQRAAAGKTFHVCSGKNLTAFVSTQDAASS